MRDGLDVVGLDELVREEQLELLFNQGKFCLVPVHLCILELVSLGQHPVVCGGRHDDLEVVVLALVLRRNQSTVIFLRQFDTF